MIQKFNYWVRELLKRSQQLIIKDKHNTKHYIQFGFKYNIIATQTFEESFSLDVKNENDLWKLVTKERSNVNDATKYLNRG